MISVAFTGPARRIESPEIEIVRKVIKGIRNADMFYSGAAVGIDCFAAGLAIENFPEARHVVVLPTWKHGYLPYHEIGVDALWDLADKWGAEIDIIDCPNSDHCDTYSQGYMRRNDVMIANCTHLIAFPSTKKEKRRSGTWATVRRARKAGRTIKFAPLDGRKHWVER